VRRAILATLFGVSLAPANAPGQESASEGPFYHVSFEARIIPTEREARIRWTLGSGSSAMHALWLRIDPKRQTRFRGDGEVRVEDDQVEWIPPSSGGSLRYSVRIDSTRDEGGGYDGRCAQDWALFRGDDLFPPARVRTEKGAKSISTLRLVLPEGWSSVTRYAPARGGSIDIADPLRSFDRPTGWMVVGKLGVLRERVAGSRIAVGGPVGHGVRRQDILAMLRWTLPTLRDIIGQLPERIAIVSAGDPMWRGGLSGVASVFLHADRPLIANDATSPLLHEVFHAATRARSGPDGDWIVEGLAEYYSLELLVRSHTMSRSRHERALTRLEARGRGASLRGVNSSGAHTARAVTVLREIDRQLRKRSEGHKSLDDVVARLVEEPGEITVARLRAVCEQVAGEDLGAFFASLPRVH